MIICDPTQLSIFEDYGWWISNAMEWRNRSTARYRCRYRNSIWFFRIAINLITGFANTQNWCTTRSCSWFRCCGSVLLCWYFKGCSSAGTLAHRYRHTASCNLMKEPAMLVEIVVYLWRILHARYHLWRSVAWHDIDGRTANRWSCDIAN